MKRILQYSFLYPFLLILWIISFFPRFIQKKIALIYALFVYLILPSRSKIINNNIAIAYPNYTKEERRKLLVKNYKSLGFCIIEMANAWFWSKDKLKKATIIKGLEHLTKAKKNKQGVIFVTPHFNNLEIIVTMLSCHIPINFTFSTPKNKVFSEFLSGRRKRITKNSSVTRNFKQLINVLKRREYLQYAPDQSKCEKNAPIISFFSKKVKTTAGTYKLAKLGNAQIVLVNPYFDNIKKKYIIQLLPPLDISNLSSIETTTLVNQAIENVINQNPEQYMWIHKRFK